MRISFLWKSFFLWSVFLTTSSAQATHVLVAPGGTTSQQALLNAYRSPLSAMTAPNSFYFLEFPIQESNTTGPICGDGTPYSFAFKRGSDKHMRKLLVEFEGGPACYDWGQDDTPLWDDGNSTMNETICSCQTGHRQTPWQSYIETDQQTLVLNGLFPPLGSCRGITDGLIRFGGESLFNMNGNMKDFPLGVRQPSEDGLQKWWEHLDDNIHDWSYLLLPHCTLDWNLGLQETVQPSADATCQGEHFFRGGRNLQAVTDWVNSQFPAIGGLEALITLPSGQLGGCSSSADRGDENILSTVAPMLFANGIVMDEGTSKRKSSTRKLVMLDGSQLLRDKLPVVETFQDLWGVGQPFWTLSSTTGDSDIIQALIRDTNASFAWFSGIPQSIDDLEWTESWLELVSRDKEGAFHIFNQGTSAGTESSDECPIYTFPDDATSESENVKTFIEAVISTMAWSSESTSSVATVGEDQSDASEGFRLTFLSITIITVGIYVVAWAVYWSIVQYRKSQGIAAMPQSPHDLWLTALTHHPRIFLLVSLAIPLFLSFLGISKSGYTVQMNLDFDSYLTIDTDLETVSKSVEEFRRYQDDSVVIEDDNCRILEDGASSTSRRQLLDELRSEEKGKSLSSLDNLFGDPDGLRTGYNQDHRDLQYELYWGTGPVITIIYQNRNGGNVFEPDVLREIRDFEQQIYDFPGFDQYCLTVGFRCLPFDSIIPTFFPAGYLTENIEGVVSTFLGDQTSLWKVDQYFGADNLASNITRTFIWLRDGDEEGTNAFLERLYKDLLWKADQDKRYPNMLFTWDNGYLFELEANEAVAHDALWASGSFIIVGIMIFVKINNWFVFLASILGLGLSFLSAYYWCLINFGIQEITLLHISSLFVMIGIGADDIFLMVDSFEHTKISIKDKERTMEGEHGGMDESDAAHSDANSEASHGKNLSPGSPDLVRTQKTDSVDFEILRKRMKLAYQTAGSMMLVSSLTTAICFFSNAFAVVIVIKDFGNYMGMVVLINFVHVMTILPSAILVYEMYIVPWKKKWSGPNLEPRSSKVIREPSHLELDVPSDDVLFDESMRPSIGGCTDVEDLSNRSNAIESCERNRSKRTASWNYLLQRFEECNDGSADEKSEGGVRSQHDNMLEGSLNNVEKEDLSAADALLDCSALLSDDDSTEEIYDQPSTVSRPVESAENVDMSSENRSEGQSRPYHDDGVDTCDRDEFHRATVETAKKNYNEPIGETERLLANVSELGCMDRWLVKQYSSFVVRKRTQVTLILGLLSMILGVLGVLTFEISADSIILFSEKYNLGRLTPLTDTYFDSDLSQSIGKDDIHLPSPGSGGGDNNDSGGDGSGSGAALGGGSNGGSSGDSSAGSSGGSDSSTFTTAPSAGPLPDGSSPAGSTPTFGGGSGGSTGASPTGSSGGGSGSGLPVCEGLCQNGGICNFAGTCTCFDGWTGDYCSIPICPGGIVVGYCTGNGDCLPHPNGVRGSTICQCYAGYAGSDCSVDTSGGNNVPLERKQAIVVSLVWGAERLDERRDWWVIRGRYSPPNDEEEDFESTTLPIEIGRGLDVADPTFQEWMLEVVKMARNRTNLSVEAGPTWIEIVEKAAIDQGIGFPIPKDLFSGFLQLLNQNNNVFSELINKDLGTYAPGLAGDYIFASVTLLAEVKGSIKSTGSETYIAWSDFVEELNTKTPKSILPVVAQCKTFLSVHRSEKTISSTGSSWVISNLLCLLIILGFTRSFRLSAMVTVVIILMFLCLAGLLFAIFALPFGPVEALGVSIFIGLSANYSLHIVHAYAHSAGKTREDKVLGAMFTTGSPIIASALSTIAGCMFLFGCRTYVFLELGLLICSITTLALIFSMSFLPAWLAMIGPLPRESVEASEDESTTKVQQEIRDSSCSTRVLEIESPGR